MIQPDYKTFCRLARQGNLVPVYDTFTADLLTPVSAYLRLARAARYSFLLESVEGGEKIARYTFAGADPVEVFRYAKGSCIVEGERRLNSQKANPIEFLRHRLGRYRPVRVPGLPPLVGGAIGYFAYDMVRLIERIPEQGRDDLGLDDAVLMFYLGLVAFDHIRTAFGSCATFFPKGRAACASSTTPRSARSLRRDARSSGRSGERRMPGSAGHRGRAPCGLYPICSAAVIWPPCTRPSAISAPATSSRWC